MKFIRGLHNFIPAHRGCVATIGNFDGLHLGHESVIRQLRQQSERHAQSSLVMSFEPLPHEYFMRTKTIPTRLIGLRDKIKRLTELSVDYLLCLHFNVKLANTEPEDFIKKILVNALGVQCLIVGDDFRFGKNRRGDFALLSTSGQEFGFEVVKTETFSIDGERVSSTRIRDALLNGDLHTAQKLLGRNYSLCGRVAHGDKRGRTIGFPTANFVSQHHRLPISGVFAVKVWGLGGRALHGVANVGKRPTVDGHRELLEVHLLDFDEDIYGQHIEVELCQRLRDEKRFASLDELTAQIHRDVSAARQFFN